MKVFLIAAVTADGFMGLDVNHRSLDWRSKEDAETFIRLTKDAGVMVMGSKTFATFRIKRTPPGRRLVIYTRKPESVQGEGVETTSEDPNLLIKRLESEGATGLAVCGGATINKLFMDSGLLNELYLTVEPVLFGQGIPIFSGQVNASLKLLEVTSLNENTLLLHYKVDKEHPQT
jgi:dihydrofolate reductase